MNNELHVAPTVDGAAKVPGQTPSPLERARKLLLFERDLAEFSGLSERQERFERQLTDLGRDSAPRDSDRTLDVRLGGTVEEPPQPALIEEERLGEGPHGAAYRVDGEQGTTVVKVLSERLSNQPEFPERFADFLRARNGFRHWTILPITGAGVRPDGKHFIGTTWIDGFSCGAMLERGVALRPAPVLEMARQILSGLEEGHAAGMGHGSLVPENVFLDRIAADVTPFGIRVRLTDYGLRTLERPPGENGAREDMVQTDLQSVGMLMLELHSGQHRVAMQSSASSNEGRLDLPISRPIRQLMVRALATERDQCYSSARDFRRAVEDVQQS